MNYRLRTSGEAVSLGRPRATGLPLVPSEPEWVLAIPTAPVRRNGGRSALPIRQLGQLLGGSLGFFSYSGAAVAQPDREFSSGAQAIATLYDYWGVNIEPFNATYRGAGLADDGRLHYPPSLVRSVYNAIPPAAVETGLMVARFNPSEAVRRALETKGIATDLAMAAESGGDEGRRRLEIWLARTGRPVLCLVSQADLWPQLFDDWYASLHWVFVHGYTRDYVLLAFDEAVHAVRWEVFLRGWHCRRLSDPHQFSAVYSYV